jgi:hypothetical protein
MGQSGQLCCFTCRCVSGGGWVCCTGWYCGAGPEAPSSARAAQQASVCGPFTECKPCQQHQRQPRTASAPVSSQGSPSQQPSRQPQSCCGTQRNIIPCVGLSNVPSRSCASWRWKPPIAANSTAPPRTADTIFTGQCWFPQAIVAIEPWHSISSSYRWFAAGRKAVL